MGKRILYHGSTQMVDMPEIRIAKYNKDFYFGFYCTVMKQQAERWAARFGGTGYMDGKISREAFWALAKFKYPTHQISFHTVRALTTLKFLEGVPIYEQ